MAAATQALDDAGWHPTTTDDQIATGVLIGSGIGGLQGIEEAALTLHDKGPRRISPFFIPGRLINLACGQVSIRHGCKGPNHAVVTACSTGAHAIGDAARLIVLGDADVMVAGGTEAPVCRLALAGFAACRALSTAFNDEPAARLAALGPGPRRLRHGRGRRLRRARGVRARQGARRQDLCRGDRLRPVRATPTTSPPRPRMATAPIAACRWRSSAPASTPARSTTSTPMAPRRHRRRDRTRRRRAAVRQCGGELVDVVDQIGDRPSARRGRRDRGDLLDPGDPRPDRAADAQPRQSRRSRRRSTSCRSQAKKRDDRYVLSNSFGFGGTNASLVLRRVEAARGPKAAYFSHRCGEPIPDRSSLSATRT